MSALDHHSLTNLPLGRTIHRRAPTSRRESRARAPA